MTAPLMVSQLVLRIIAVLFYDLYDRADLPGAILQDVKAGALLVLNQTNPQLYSSDAIFNAVNGYVWTPKSICLLFFLQSTIGIRSRQSHNVKCKCFNW